MPNGPYLGVDYGAKWIGVAFTDPEQIMVLPGGFLKTNNEEEKIDYIVSLCQEKKITKVIIGIPLTESGRETEQAKLSHKFLEGLKEKIDLPIKLFDETLSTFAAQEKGMECGVKFPKGEEDCIAAMIILENYLKEEE